jgi:DNA-binding IclR family transcriptional regulator
LSDNQGIQVIARAAAILRTLETSPSGCSLGEIANKTGLPRSTVQRIIGALIDEQFVMSSHTRGSLKLGPALLRLAASANVEIDRLVRPFLEALARETGETVDLSVLHGPNAVFVDQVSGSSRLIAVSAIGESFPLHCTANGKALLACVAPERQDILLSRSLERFTPATIVDHAALKGQLASFLSSQITVDIEEHTQGICAIGTAFLDALGREFAVSVPVPSGRFHQTRADIERALLATRDAMLLAIPGSRIKIDHEE